MLLNQPNFFVFENEVIIMEGKNSIIRKWDTLDTHNGTTLDHPCYDLIVC